MNPTETLKIALRLASLTAIQRKKIWKFLDFGAELDVKSPTIVWFNGHCFHVTRTGKVDEL